MSKESEQLPKESKGFKLGPLGNLNQVTKALGKTIRAMADGTLDSQIGARICNGLGIMRTALETATLERIEERLNQFDRSSNKWQHDKPSPGYRSALIDSPAHLVV